MEFLVRTSGVEETIAWGVKAGRALPRGARVFLHGEMGSGKTHFTKGLYVGAFGGDASDVSSPTYAMVNVYGDPPRAFVHADLHRLTNPDHFETLDADDFLFGHPGPTVIEWPELAGNRLDDVDRLDVDFECGATESERSLRFRSHTPTYDAVIEEIRR